MIIEVMFTNLLCKFHKTTSTSDQTLEIIGEFKGNHPFFGGPTLYPAQEAAGIGESVPQQRGGQSGGCHARTLAEDEGGRVETVGFFGSGSKSWNC